jgi:hypothetical protein
MTGQKKYFDGFLAENGRKLMPTQKNSAAAAFFRT